MINHVWVGQFSSEDEFLSYIDQSDESILNFNKELGLDFMDEYYRNSYFSDHDFFDSLLVNLPVGLKEFLPVWKSKRLQSGNAFICLSECLLVDTEPCDTEKMKYIGAFFHQ